MGYLRVHSSLSGVHMGHLEFMWAIEGLQGTLQGLYGPPGGSYGLLRGSNGPRGCHMSHSGVQWATQGFIWATQGSYGSVRVYIGHSGSYGFTWVVQTLHRTL